MSFADCLILVSAVVLVLALIVGQAHTKQK